MLIINGFDLYLWEDYELKINQKSLLTKLKSLKDYFAINGFKKTLIKVINYLEIKPAPKTWKTDMKKAVATVKPKLFIAKKSGLKVISLIGKSGGLLKNMSDHFIHVESNVTSFIQEAHISILHCICENLEDIS